MANTVKFWSYEAPILLAYWMLRVFPDARGDHILPMDEPEVRDLEVPPCCKLSSRGFRGFLQSTFLGLNADNPGSVVQPARE
jgi:hypothetical protein